MWTPFRMAICEAKQTIVSEVSRQFHLTKREQQAVELLLQGRSNKEIAKNMGISAHTVKAFLRMASVKLGASDRSGIVIKVLDLLLSASNSEPSNLRSNKRTAWRVGGKPP